MQRLSASEGESVDSPNAINIKSYVANSTQQRESVESPFSLFPSLASADSQKSPSLAEEQHDNSPSLAEGQHDNSPSLAEGDLGGGSLKNATRHCEQGEALRGNPQSLKWREFKIGELFSVKSNPQLNKDSFNFSENGEYPYFTRTCENNGISGYVDYLDEAHKIKGGGLAAGMLGMQFFYMAKDLYAGQFTKTCYPKFEGFNQKIAHFFIAWLNKSQKAFQGVLVRDFEQVFNETKIILPVSENGKIAFEFMEIFIKAVEKEVIKGVVLWSEKNIQAHKDIIESKA